MIETLAYASDSNIMKHEYEWAFQIPSAVEVKRTERDFELERYEREEEFV